MGEYASKGVAGTGLGLGIAGTALGLMNNNCGCGGFLGNIFGGNCNQGMRMGAELQYVSQLQAENAMLKAERSTDEKIKETYMQTLADNNRVRDELYAFINPLAKEAADNRVKIATLEAEQKCCCEKQELQAQITAGKINETALVLNGKIDNVKSQFDGTFNALNNTLACISGSIQNVTARLDAITSEIIPLCKVCPQPMQRFNTWAQPTGQAPDCTK